MSVLSAVVRPARSHFWGLGVTVVLVGATWSAWPSIARGDEPSAADGGAAPPLKKTSTLDQLLDDAVPTAQPAAKPAPSAEAPPPPDAKPVAAKQQRPVAPAPRPVVPAAPITDDNDGYKEAVAPRALAPVAKTTQTRVRGPYDLGPLDCRVLDGAGIERILPGRLIAGEEPDLLCRVIITQPPAVATMPHQVTFSVFIGERETYRQVRNVRMSSIGRRALVFVVPMDKIAAEEPSDIHITAHLSAPATPGGGRSIKFRVESED